MLDFLNNILNWILPRSCLACGLIADNFYLDLCDYCKQLLPWYQGGCVCCGILLQDKDGLVCTSCQQAESIIAQTKVLFFYKRPINSWLNTNTKNLGCKSKILASLLLEKVHSKWYCQEELPEVIVIANTSDNLCRYVALKLAINLNLSVLEDIDLLQQKCDKYTYASLLVPVMNDKISYQVTITNILIAGIKTIDIWCLARS